jgi:hypothetical protein
MRKTHPYRHGEWRDRSLFPPKTVSYGNSFAEKSDLSLVFRRFV